METASGVPKAEKKPRIGIVRLSSLGDVIHGTPVSRALREHFGPSAYIAWTVEKAFAEVLQGNPYLDDLIIWERGTGLQGFLDFVRRLRAARLEMTLDIQGLWKSGWTALLSGAKTRFGYERSREWSKYFANVLLDSRNKGKGLGIVDQYLDVVAQATGYVAPSKDFVLCLSEQERSWAEEWYAAHGLTPHRGTAVICPGSSAYIRCWIEEWYAELIEWMADSHGLHTVLLGTQHDAQVIRAIADRAAVPVTQCVGESSIRESAALIGLAELYVGGDTGPTYLAAAVGAPIVGIFGSTKNNGKLTNPDRHIALESSLPCTSVVCYQFNCKTKECMRDIPLERVRDACQSLLQRSAQTAGAKGGSQTP